MEKNKKTASIKIWCPSCNGETRWVSYGEEIECLQCGAHFFPQLEMPEVEIRGG